jgi:sugar transferase (PEP-CTERM system associated)
MSPGAAMFLLDAILVALAWPIAAFVTLPSVAAGPGMPAALPALLPPLVDLLFLYALGLYRRDAITATWRSLGRLPVSIGMGALTAALGTAALPMLLPLPPVTRQAPALLFAAAVLCFAACALAARALFTMLRRHHLLRPRLLVIGAGRRAWDLVWLLRREGRNLQYDVTFLHHPAFGARDIRLMVGNAMVIDAGSADDAAADVLAIARRLRADEIVIAPDERRGMPLDSLIACKTAGFPVHQYMGFLEREIRRIDIKRLDLSWVLYSDGFTFSLLERAAKRAIDVIASLLLLAFSSPFLLGAMLLIRFEDGGPVFYRQERVTQYGHIFRILKLRSMRCDAEAAGVTWTARNDRRVTRIGALLRRTRLDEVPQLVNVLSGAMSLVGPRPERPEFTCELARRIPLYNERHIVRAGLTGWAQVNYPYGASVDDARSKLSYDLYYVKNFSLLFDLQIIVQTLRVLLWPSGVR